MTREVKPDNTTACCESHPGLRIGFVGVLLFATAAGLGARYGLTGFWAKYLGVALWATIVHALILVVRPSLRVTCAAGLALMVSWGVEFAQLSPLPATLSSYHIVLSWVFGSTFSPWDLPAYLAGVSLGAGVHCMLLWRQAR